MKPKKNAESSYFLARSLGASRVVKLGERSSNGPLGWIEMAQHLRQRLVSRGGRPSDPCWNTKRLVPFRRETWKRLTQKAHAMSVHGRKVGPAHLAALLIEQHL